MLRDQFVIAGGSVMGYDHSDPLKRTNNQDAYKFCVEDNFILAVLSDGCGSGVHSEFGAKLLTAFVLKSIREKMLELQKRPGFDKDFRFPYWDRVKQEALSYITVLAGAMGTSFSQTINDYFLATLVVAIITPGYTEVRFIGDGFVFLNGQEHEVGPYDTPPYIVYNIVDSDLRNSATAVLSFYPVFEIRTPVLQNLLLATDGLRFFRDASTSLIPKTRQPLGPISQFWEDPLFTDDQGAISRRLKLANWEILRPDWVNERLVKYPALLLDDTTIVVVKRVKQE